MGSVDKKVCYLSRNPQAVVRDFACGSVARERPEDTVLRPGWGPMDGHVWLEQESSPRMGPGGGAGGQWLSH